MKKEIKISILLLVMIICSGLLNAQATNQYNTVRNDNGFDARLLNHYTEDELVELQQNAPEKFDATVYYYTNSYTLEIMDDCFDCLETNPSTFDITPYEQFREQNDIGVYKDYKHGFILYLVPFDELEHVLQVQIEIANK